jgi:hypothetical protein
LKMVQLAIKAKLLNPSISKFVHYYLDDSLHRQELYARWTLLRNIRPQLPVIQKLILKEKRQVLLIFGKFDRIILPKRGYRFAQAAPQNIQVKELAGGHQLLHPKWAAVFSDYLLQDS